MVEDLFNDEGTEVLFDKPEVIEAVQWVSDLSNVEHAAPILQRRKIRRFILSRKGQQWHSLDRGTGGYIDEANLIGILLKFLVVKPEVNQDC